MGGCPSAWGSGMKFSVEDRATHTGLRAASVWGSGFRVQDFRFQVAGWVNGIRCRSFMAHIRQPRPDSGLPTQAKVLESERSCYSGVALNVA